MRPDMWAAQATVFPPSLPVRAADQAVRPTSSLATSLRSELRAHAGRRPLPIERNSSLAAVRPIVDAARAELRNDRRHGASHRQLALIWCRLLDAAVLEIYRMARIQARIDVIVAPLTVVATGPYGEQALLPEDPAGLLLLVPSDRREFAGRRIGQHVVENLRAVGLAVGATTATPAACVAAAGDDPHFLLQLASARHLAGSYGPWAAVRERVLGP